MPEGPRPKSLSARVGTFNWPARYALGGAEADAKLAADLLGQASVWGFQEAAWLPSQLPGWAGRHLSSDSTGKRNGQILAWRKDVWGGLRFGSFVISPATRIQQGAAGPTIHREKHIVWADLLHNQSGEVVRFGVVHFVPSKHLGGAALTLWKLQRDGAIKWLSSSPHACVLLGDFNAEPTDPAAQPLIKAAAGVLSGPSLGRRAVDWIVYSKPLTGSGVRVLPNTKQSDHRPVMGTVSNG